MLTPDVGYTNCTTAINMATHAHYDLSQILTATLSVDVSALAMFIPSPVILWSSAMGIGLGVASSFPAASQVLIAACKAVEASSRAWAIVGRRVAQRSTTTQESSYFL